MNVSPVQFQSGDLASKIVRILAKTGLPPQRLELEITETLLLEGTEQNFAILHQLRSLGVTIALDDFGTGYSSLSYLHAFPLDKIKIDRSFVREIAHAAYGTKAEHYVVVADALLWVLEKRLGDAFTPEVKAAWVKVYTTLAVAMQAGAAQATIQRPEGRPRRKLGRR